MRVFAQKRSPCLSLFPQKSAGQNRVDIDGSFFGGSEWSSSLVISAALSIILCDRSLCFPVYRPCKDNQGQEAETETPQDQAVMGSPPFPLSLVQSFIKTEPATVHKCLIAVERHRFNLPFASSLSTARRKAQPRHRRAISTRILLLPSNR